jgi:hypothetical protein
MRLMDVATKGIVNLTFVNISDSFFTVAIKVELFDVFNESS